MGNKIGYWFEDQIKASLKRLQEGDGTYFHRFQDSKAAGNITASAPADFLVGCFHEAQLWECKASEIYFSLSECLSDMVGLEQAAHMLWWEGNGLDSWYLFYSDKTGVVEAWEGFNVSKHRQKGSSLKDPPDKEGHIDNLDTLLREILE